MNGQRRGRVHAPFHEGFYLLLLCTGRMCIGCARVYCALERTSVTTPARFVFPDRRLLALLLGLIGAVVMVRTTGARANNHESCRQCRVHPLLSRRPSGRTMPKIGVSARQSVPRRCTRAQTRLLHRLLLHQLLHRLLVPSRPRRSYTIRQIRLAPSDLSAR